MSQKILSSLEGTLLNAQKRLQPYINLTNTQHTIADLFNEAAIEAYRKQKLKSVYCSTKELKLNEKFATNVQSAIDAGIKEILIFCDKENSNLDSAQFNEFLEQNRIRINIKVVQISKEDLKKIKKDSVGNKDLLGFSSLLNNQITYENGFTLNLLNNNRSDEIILENHDEYKKYIAKQHSFTAPEPVYITSSDPNAEKRIKDPNKLKITLETQHQVNRNNELNSEVEQALDKEEEISIDQEQDAHKLNKSEATRQAKILIKSCFYEFYIAMNSQELNYATGNSLNTAGRIVDNLFKSDEGIAFVSYDALTLIIQNYFLFQEGINVENMPLGLAYTNGVIFTSDQRKKSMPINDFTVKFDEINPKIINPLQYSWLLFATKASISLDDLYGTPKAPKLKGVDKHPATRYSTIDNALDIPVNLLYSEYKIREDNYTGEEFEVYKKDISTHKFQKYETQNYKSSLSPNVNILKHILNNKKFDVEQHALPPKAIDIIKKYSVSKETVAKLDMQETFASEDTKLHIDGNAQEQNFYHDKDKYFSNDGKLILDESISFKIFKRLSNDPNFNFDDISLEKILTHPEVDKFLTFILSYEKFDPSTNTAKMIIRHDNYKLTKLLFSHRKFEMIERYETLEDVLKYCNTELVKLFVSNKEFHPSAREVLDKIIKYGNDEVMKALISHENFYANSKVLDKIIKYGNDEVMKALISHENFYADSKVLDKIIAYGNNEIIQTFLSNKSLYLNDIELLDKIIKYGNNDVTKTLLSHKRLNPNGKTLDKIIASPYKNEFIKVLVSNKKFLNSMYLSDTDKDIVDSILNEISADIDFAVEQIKKGASIAKIAEDFKYYYKIINGISEKLKSSQNHLEKWTEAISSFHTYDPNYYVEGPSPSATLIIYNSKIFEQFVVIHEDFDPNINNILQEALGIPNGVFASVNLSQSDVSNLHQIRKELLIRNLLDIFENVIKSNYIQDSEFLLQEKTAKFFNKLFNDILPLNDFKKIDFFKQVLSQYQSTRKVKDFKWSPEYQLKSQSSFEDVFEGVNGCYKKLQRFLQDNDIPEVIHADMESRLAKVISSQIKKGFNLRVIEERTWSLLEHTTKQAGSLNEQLEYLTGNKILQDPQQYVKAKSLNINTLHESEELNLKNADYYYTDKITLKILTKQLLEIDSKEEILDHTILLRNARRYLGTQSSHHRTSIDTYLKFYTEINGNDFSITKRDSKYLDPNHPLRTVEYINFASPEKIYNTHNEYKQKKEGILSNAHRDFNTLRDLVASTPTVTMKEPCYTPIAVTSVGSANLVRHFTSKQASENIRLLVLNILTSAGKYYDSQYPDQEFNAFISLFNVLFAKVKIYDDIEVGTRKLYPYKDYNHYYIDIQTEVKRKQLPQDVIEKEVQHKKLVDSFISIHSNNPKFNFVQVVSTGLVQNATNDSVESELTDLINQYGYHVSQFLRILLSTPISSDNSFDELNNRASAIKNTIKNLFNADEVTTQATHKFLTNEGKNPENLEFFALCFGQKEAVSHSELELLITKIDNLDLSLKNKLLQSYAKLKLPFDNGEIITYENFPNISLETLDDPSAIEEAIAKLENYHNSEEEIAYKTRFNNPGTDVIKNAKIDLSEIEDKYKIQIPEEIKNKNFRELKKEILKDKEFVKNNILQQKNPDGKLIKDISFDIVKSMFEAIEITRIGKWQQKIAKIITLLFNTEESLHNQILNIEFNKINLDKLFKNCADDFEKEALLDGLLKIPNLEEESLRKTLIFLKNIDTKILQKQGLKLPDLISDKSQELIAKYFELFEATTNFYLENDIVIEIQDLYQLVGNIADKSSNISIVKKVLTYCAENQDFSLISILSNLDAKTHDIDSLIDWFISLKSSDIIKLAKNSNLDFNKLFKINSIKKTQILIDIALKLGNHISDKQYQKIINKVTRSDVTYAKLLHSHLTAPSQDKHTKETKLTPKNKASIVKNNLDSLEDAQKMSSDYGLGKYVKLLYSYLTGSSKNDQKKELASNQNGKKEAITTKDKIDIVMKNLNSLEKAQKIFSDYGLWRFDYKHTELLAKIYAIKRKNIGDSDEHDLLLTQEVEELYKSTILIYDKVRNYKDLNSNEIYVKSIELKRKYSLLKDNSLIEQRELVLEFLALVAEMMYRTSDDIIKAGLFPRSVQMLSIVNTIVHEGLNIVEEIATGEGKSITTAYQALYLWFTGKTVDVVSSSPELAQRDLHDFSPLYRSLGVPHSENIINANSDISDYKKGGINYGTASDIALFRADRGFYSEKNDFSLNTDVSLVCDEVDFTLTSEINYKLAAPIIDATQLEVKTLFGSILEFTNTGEFKNTKVSRPDDVKNLKEFLKSKFQKHNDFYSLSLQEHQIDDLKTNNPDLYYLYNAYQKCKEANEIDVLLDQWLDAAVTAKGLKKGQDYVLPFAADNIAEDESLQKAVPLIKHQPAKGVLFGNGVQTFLHLLIEEKYPEYQNKFDMSPPADTIFNISPKNFFDYYIMTGGNIIGLTGTAGDKNDLEEFRTINKLISFSIPRHEEYKGIKIETEVPNQDEQYLKMTEVINEDIIRPIIIFCDNPEEAEDVFSYLKQNKPIFSTVQLFAASPNDTEKDIADALKKAGKERYITVTTPLLGRGTDFKTKYADGFLGINLCEDLTSRDLWQIYGRVARNGKKGAIISLFDKEKYLGKTIVEHMINIAKSQKDLRSKSQPLTDILQYFNQQNKDQTQIAIQFNNVISQKWYDLLKANNKLTPDARKSYFELQDDLVAALKKQYPKITEKLDNYLEKVSSNIPDKILQNDIDNMSPNFSDILVHFEYMQKDSVPIFHSNTYQEYKALYVEQELKHQQTKISLSDNFVSKQLYRAIPITRLVTPTTNYESLNYNIFYQYQMAVMSTHVFSIEQPNFEFPMSYNIGLLNNEYVSSNRQVKIEDNEMIVSLNEDHKLYCQIKGKAPLEIKSFSQDTGLVSIPKKIYTKILTILRSSKDLATSKLPLEIKNYIANFALKSGYISTIKIKGEGSGGDLMLSEFKKSFSDYKIRTKSKEVSKIAKLIDNFLNIKDVDTSKLQLGKYQAISIATLINSNESHAETILTNGKFLFWINRGGGSNKEPGIKVFKIIKDISDVRNILDSLKTPKSQADTRKVIYSLLREDADNKIPDHAWIPMDPQKIGNCGWVQVKSMLKALGVIGRIGNLDELPDITSQEWQKALKDSDDIYLDFEKYDMIKRYEAIIFSFDKDFVPKFLSQEEQNEINIRRDIIENPAPHELLTRLSETLSKDMKIFDKSPYEKQAHNILRVLKLEAAIDDDPASLLQLNNMDRKAIKDILKSYKDINSFEHLDQLYKTITMSSIENKVSQAVTLQKMIQYTIDNSYYIYDNLEFTSHVKDISSICASSIDSDALTKCLGEQLEIYLHKNGD